VSARRAALLLALVVAGACRRAPDAPAAPAPVASAPPASPAPPPASPDASASASVAPAEEDLVGEAPESNPGSDTVKIKLIAEASRKARVSWGRKDLGFAPLELERPRGSGPVDLLIVAPGALPLHTRVYTDRDEKLALRLYAESEGPSLLGYHEPPPSKPGADGDAKRKARAPKH
jgi:hypothetical protein